MCNDDRIDRRICCIVTLIWWWFMVYPTSKQFILIIYDTFSVRHYRQSSDVDHFSCSLILCAITRLLTVCRLRVVVINKFWGEWVSHDIVWHCTVWGISGLMLFLPPPLPPPGQTHTSINPREFQTHVPLTVCLGNSNIFWNHTNGIVCSPGSFGAQWGNCDLCWRVRRYPYERVL